jgi:hypothetical protein
VGNQGSRISFEETYPTNRLLNSMRVGVMECNVRGIIVQEFILAWFRTHSVPARWVTDVFFATEDYSGTN